MERDSEVDSRVAIRMIFSVLGVFDRYTLYDMNYVSRAFLATAHQLGTIHLFGSTFIRVTYSLIKIILNLISMNTTRIC